LPAVSDDASVVAFVSTAHEKQMLEMRELPVRVTRFESQIVRLRQQMRDECSAIRLEFRTELHGAINGLGDELRGEIADAARSLRTAIEETNTHMRALHEDTIQRIATMREGRRTRRKK
jgi:hypothetical protein